MCIDSFQYDFYHLFKNDVNMDEKPARKTDRVKIYHKLSSQRNRGLCIAHQPKTIG